MSMITDAVANAKARIAARAKTPALPCVVFLTGTRLDPESGTLHPTRRMVSTTDGYDLVAGIDPERGIAARHCVLCWQARNFTFNPHRLLG